MKKIIFFLFIIFLTGSQTSCYKKDLEEFEKVKFQLEPEIAMPIFNATLTVSDSVYFPNLNINDSVVLSKQDIDLKSLDDVLNQNGIEKIQIKLYIENSFPIEGDLQVYFLNADNIPMDSLFVIEKHKVQNSKISEVFIDIDKSKLNTIANSKKVKIFYSYKKTNLSLEEYKLFVGCGVIFKIKY